MEDRTPLREFTVAYIISATDSLDAVRRLAAGRFNEEDGEYTVYVSPGATAEGAAFIPTQCDGDEKLHEATLRERGWSRLPNGQFTHPYYDPSHTGADCWTAMMDAQEYYEGEENQAKEYLEKEGWREGPSRGGTRSFNSPDRVSTLATCWNNLSSQLLEVEVRGELIAEGWLSQPSEKDGWIDFTHPQHQPYTGASWLDLEQEIIKRKMQE